MKPPKSPYHYKSPYRHPQQHRSSGSVGTVFICIALGVLAIAIASWAFGTHASDGSRVGYITKFSKSGTFSKTWEGDMQMGPMATDNNKSGVFQFTVDDDSLVGKVQAAHESGKKVKVTYYKKRINFSVQGDTPYRVTGVEVIP